MDNELYKELYDLRSKLKSENVGGRVSVVCSDAALAEIARLKPKKKEELLYITGLGKTFVEKYGDAFMKVLSQRNKNDIKCGLLCPDVKATLKNLENRLVNVNKRNRLLYMPKLNAGYSYNLVKDGKSAKNNAYNARLIEFIKRFEENKRFMICDAFADEDAETEIKKLNMLLREANRAYRESGENDLYVAYPFVIGKMSGENFNVRAPLMLFPVEIITEQSNVFLKMDTSKDTLFNSSLVLSYNKFNGIANPIPSNVVEDVDAYGLFAQIKKFYSECGFNLRDSQTKGALCFKEYTAQEFPKFKGGEFYIEENCVLGKFSMYSSALQKDFKAIREASDINELLNDLLQRVEDVDIYSDSEDLTDKDIQTPYSENNISYINDLNMSQEMAIFSLNNTNKLVVQGPPGTGKSQTITSMIADFVVRGKNVLMVSQKKAALDVIYSRLGNLSKYALLINDVKNKDFFYEQMTRIFEIPELLQAPLKDYNNVSMAIEADLKRLDTLADKLYYSNKYGCNMYQIYEEDTHSSFDHNDVERLNLFANNVPSDLYNIGYLRIKKARKLLQNVDVQANAKLYYDLVNDFNWLVKMPSNLNQIAVASLVNDGDKIVDLYVQYRSKHMFARASLKRKYKKAVKSFIKSNFIAYDRSLVKIFIKNPIDLYNGLTKYNDFFLSKQKFDELDNADKLYFGTCYNIADGDAAQLTNAINALPEFTAYYYINDFEVENRDVLSVLDNYGLILKDIASNFTRKKTLSRDCLKAQLISAIDENIISSKRKGEMMRVIESKRKWNIQRYISKFSFELFKGIKIWLLTPEVVSEILPLENGLFDLLIFDEASQIYIEKGVPSIARAKKVVIAGDHKQLRPSSLGVGRLEYDEDVIDENANAALEEESLLDLARFKYPEILLNYHYRSQYEELIAFSNYAFYKGRLNVSPNFCKSDVPPIQVYYTPDGLWQDRRNVAEAEKVIKLIKNILVNRKNNETLGVITFNSNQRDLILDMLDSLCATNPSFATMYKTEVNRAYNGEDVGLFVKNIENVQGDERDNIIFSLAYAKAENGKVVRNFGWLNQVGGENRLNVAISRAKRKVDIVTSIKPNELVVDDLTNEGPKILKKYLEYAYDISSGNIDSAREVLKSFGGVSVATTQNNYEFVIDVYKALLQEGFNVQRNVGIGTYKIDLAIKDKNDKFVLGIECDCTLYNDSRLARERDVHRRRYLESRGWTLYRVFSANWWRSSDGEIAKIKALINQK